MIEVDEPSTGGEPFGAWLLEQRGRAGRIGGLARAAHADAGFPKRGSPDDVRAYLKAAMAEAVDEAEQYWSAIAR